ncbi:P-type conjugative transfer protein VirB9 [Phenylobacterium aquaticum]|uniref:P-type conjugative transfer protein VirB9 n=1 Tax=Phenylobacterium aquaticum TaxID=1763816 RepID=UPI001F5D0342|nr:P-type conjugative transfer protein VirB9 [Phenylobacterium aquaticum]MCI3133370.1 P-type conjugative transfer protein VirB9 [Phenylobacterium aquaticum]
MRASLAILAAASLVIASPAAALDTPKSGPSDPRIKVVDYDPWAVVKITGVFRTATQILLGPDETILHVAVGDATGWDVAAEKNILFVKPKAARPPTNLIVTTSRGAETRNYTFELATRAGSSARNTPDTVFGLRFRYPQDEKAAAAAALTGQAAALERRIVELKLDRAVVEGHRNLNYGVQGATALQPSEVSDNGRFTVLRFPANQQVPAIYQVESSGTESLIPFDVRGEFVVVHAVVRQLRLRRGRDVLCIYNQAFEPYGVNPGTGTAAPDVQRTDQGASKP